MKTQRQPRRFSFQRGQALVEMGIVVLLMVTLAMGIVEFGRMLLVLNMVTNATRDAARAAAAIGVNSRCASSARLTSTASDAIKSMVVNQLNGYMTITSGNVTIEYPAPPSGGPSLIRVRTSVQVPWIALFNLVGTNLDVNRTVTFRDEFTAGKAGC